MKPQSDILVSVLIVNWNVEELLRPCLNALFRHTSLPAEQYEVIVVDNNSQDHSVQMIESVFPDVKLIVNEHNVGFAEGNNIAYRHAQGAYIYLLNPDTLLQCDLITWKLSMLEQERSIGALGCRMQDGYEHYRRDSGGYFPTLKNVAWNYLFFNKWLPAKWEQRPFYLEEDQPGLIAVDWISGADLFLRREALGETLFETTQFMYGEDLALCYRLQRAGWKILYSGDKTLIHYQGKSMEKQSSREVIKYLHLGPRLFFQAHHGPLSLFIYDAIHFIGFAIRWPLYRLAGLFWPNRGFQQRALFSRQYLSILVDGRSRQEAWTGEGNNG